MAPAEAANSSCRCAAGGAEHLFALDGVLDQVAREAVQAESDIEPVLRPLGRPMELTVGRGGSRRSVLTATVARSFTNSGVTGSAH